MCVDNASLELIHHSITLTPYRRSHVSTYNEWMQDPHLLETTESEPLTLEEEYAMQISWRDDPNKCTFIVQDTESGRIIGDVNLYFTNDDNSNGRREAEIEVMVAEPGWRRRGVARQALETMQAYAVKDFGTRRFVAKILDSNGPSLALFEKMGYTIFEKVACFHETHMELQVPNCHTEREGEGDDEGEDEDEDEVWNSIERRELPLEEDDDELEETQEQTDKTQLTTESKNDPSSNLEAAATAAATVTAAEKERDNTDNISKQNATIRPILPSDHDDIAELAKHTYDGHDWIMTELSNWIQSPNSLPLGIEIDGHIRALEVLRAVDDNRTAWLEALRVHPYHRNQGHATRLQRHLIRAGTDKFPDLRRVRYTTAGRNGVSIRLAVSCGMEEVYRWGFAVSSGDVGEPPDDPLFEELGFSPAAFGMRIDGELARLASVVGGGAAGGTNKATVADVLALESRLQSSASTIGLLCDWKVNELTERHLAKLFADDGVTGVSLAAIGDRPGYSLGKTRADFSGCVRVFHVVTSAEVAVEVRYGDFLRLARHECGVAVEAEATGVMFFFELELMPFLVAAGLAVEEDVCVLMSGAV